MKKDSKRDLTRAILPSTGRKSARDESRTIHRRTRHNAKQALNEVCEEDEYDDSIFFVKTNRSEKRHKSDMRWRVQRRRDGDKLGPLKRFTESVKKKSNTDIEARQKIAEIIKPGQNLITKHAMSHVDNWLDCPQVGYFLPLMNERDLQVKENENRISRRNRRGKIVWGKRKFKKIIKSLILLEHDKLNKALKDGGVRIKPCTDDDDCLEIVVRETTIREVYDTSCWKKWRKVGRGDFELYKKQGRPTRERKDLRTKNVHDIHSCKNRVIATTVDDYLRIAKTLLGHNEAIYEKDLCKPKPRNVWDYYRTSYGQRNVALRQIQALVKKHNL